jgi:hypothetical protein
MSSSGVIYSRLHLPLPLNGDDVLAFLTRLAADETRGPIVFEVRADDQGLAHLVGARNADIHTVRRHLTTYLPGAAMTGLDGYVRHSVVAAGTMKPKPPVAAFAVDEPGRVAQALYGTLARRRRGELLAVQVVMGPGRAPRAISRHPLDPSTPIPELLLSGAREATPELRARLRDDAARYGSRIVVRVGVMADSSDRRRRRALSLKNAFGTALAPGATLMLNADDPNRFNRAALPLWWTNSASAAELVQLIGWPIGERPLAGMPAPHPRVIRANDDVETKQHTFLRSAAPGDARLLGLRPRDGLFHVFACGPTGVGKTTLLEQMAKNFIADGAPLLVLDPKAQMHESLLAQIPPARWKDVVVIDGTDPNSLGFNPLDATGRDPDVVADAILSVFAATFADGFGPRTSDIYSASLRTLTRSGSPAAPTTLLDLPRLWTDPNYRRSQVAAVAADVTLAGFWAWFDDLSPSARNAVIASPMNKLRAILLRPAAVRLLGQADSPVRLRDLFRERKIVFLPLNEGLMGPGTVELLGSLVIAEAWMAIQERAAEKNPTKHPGYVIVDEADRFLNLPTSLADALARSRSLGVGWVLATQYWDQLPTAMKSAIKTNARTKVIFRMESDDDARLMARLAPELAPDDFMSLARSQVYARLVADGITTNWALASTLPPAAPISKPADVLAASQAAHPRVVAATPASTPAPTQATAAPAPLPAGVPVGRKPRSTT